MFQARVVSAGKDAYVRGWIDSGHLRDTSYDVIVHQCNCLSASGSRIANAIFQKYPEADAYKDRETHVDEMGSFRIMYTNDKKLVVHLFFQEKQGPPGDGGTDCAAKRLIAFESSLRAAIETLSRDHVVKNRMFCCPLYIGCNRVGGNWNDYYSVLCSVAERYEWSFSLYGLAGDEEFMCPYCKQLVLTSLGRQHVGSGRRCC